MAYRKAGPTEELRRVAVCVRLVHAIVVTVNAKKVSVGVGISAVVPPTTKTKIYGDVVADWVITPKAVRLCRWTDSRGMHFPFVNAHDNKIIGEVEKARVVSAIARTNYGMVPRSTSELLFLQNGSFKKVYTSSREHPRHENDPTYRMVWYHTG